MEQSIDTIYGRTHLRSPFTNHHFIIHGSVSTHAIEQLLVMYIEL